MRTCFTCRVTLSLLLMAGLAILVQGQQSYAQLDEKIVEAYNATPKKTQDVYVYSMQILERARRDSSGDAEAWEDKAQRLITVACFCEADRALDNREIQDAYIWSLRGITNGTARGEIDGVAMKQVFDYLKDMTENLEQDPSVKEMKYGKTMREVLDYRTVRKDSKYLSRDKKDLAAQPVEKDRNFEVIEGPTHDGEGKIYVKVAYNFGARMTVRYYHGKGWKAVDPPDNTKTGYYATWQDCAAANAQPGNLPGVPQSMLRNKEVEKKVYYEPATKTTGEKEVKTGD